MTAGNRQQWRCSREVTGGVEEVTGKREEGGRGEGEERERRE